MKITIVVNNDKVKVSSNGGSVVDALMALAGIYHRVLDTLKKHKAPMPPGVMEMLPGMKELVIFLDEGFKGEGRL